MFGYVFLVVGALLLSLLSAGMAKATKNGSLERNEAIGIRTKATLSSNAAWNEGHKAAIPYLNAVSITGFVGALFSVMALLFSKPHDGSVTGWQYTLPIATLVAQIIILLWSASKANQRAKSVITK
ncbi:SdpI family protein [Corynebacterium sanguinis]|uniref:SdpI family protein n=1 Tax=Corynebacterium sanguinis TaxID=2594913 RepID=UPI0021A57F7A|nr:SdpI family protein [Corynebacterium sanguinis]MCT1464752.1 SdpI family protein [Corynebacterium sanguinis]MCT2330746.1 SdpI family protein [Corynebacterium sanguinis]